MEELLRLVNCSSPVLVRGNISPETHVYSPLTQTVGQTDGHAAEIGELFKILYWSGATSHLKTHV